MGKKRSRSKPKSKSGSEVQGLPPEGERILSIAAEKLSKLEGEYHELRRVYALVATGISGLVRRVEGLQNEVRDLWYHLRRLAIMVMRLTLLMQGVPGALEKSDEEILEMFGAVQEGDKKEGD